MSRELDRRDFGESKLTSDREAELRSIAAQVSERLPGEQQISIPSFDATTGNAEVVNLESAPPERGNYVERALNYVQNISDALGLAATQPAEFAPDPHVQQTSSGAVAVHLQQLYKGIPVFEAAQAVRFAPDGAIQDTAGTSNTITEEMDVTPRLSVEEAVLRAAQHVAEPQPDEQGATDPFGEPLELSRVDLSGFEPTVIRTSSEEASRPTVLEAGPFGDEITANLLWFPMDGDVRLSWETVITMPRREGQYRTIVEADTGEILYCQQLVQFVAARGNVFVRDGAGPRQMVNFPRALGDYGLPIPVGLPLGFPEDWVEVDRSVGNSTNAHQEAAGPSIQGQVQNGVLTFNPAVAAGPDQQVLNIFYYNCYMHDFFYLLGFTEVAGNFQQNNLGRGGIGGDRVDARSHPGAVFGTANMSRSVDGQVSIMNMGLVTSTNRHTAFDSTVVFHEFMHGVTTRLVGGPQNANALNAPQSGGMGEGWGDYIACVINNVTVVGSWVLNRPGGIRGFPYDTNFPDDFCDLGTGRYTGVHNIGEIWCATLMEMTRNIGKNLAVRLVVDALSLSPVNPSFLNMRDAILRALDNLRVAGNISPGDHKTALLGIWRAFARFGMGRSAQSNGAQLTGIVCDFSVPDLSFSPVYAQGDPGNGIGGYDLQSPADQAFAFDYDRSGKQDHLALYRPGTGTIWILKNNGGTFFPVYAQGDPGNGIGGYDLQSPADQAFAFDYDRSGKQDHLALYRPGTGTIWILRNNGGTFSPVYAQGDPGNGIGGYDLQSPADRVFAFDYDRSGKQDHLALYRPGTGTIWILRNNGGSFSPVYAQGDPGNGIGGYDLQSPADRVFAFDYDRSGKQDHLALYRPSTGTIWILKNNSGVFSPVYAQGDPGNGIGGYDLQSPADRVFAFDYDRSGKQDHLALYRPSTGTIWILKNNSGVFSPVYAQGDPGNGIGGYDLQSPADRVFAFDYDGSGDQDHLALYRPGTGTIWILRHLIS